MRILYLTKTIKTHKQRYPREHTVVLTGYNPCYAELRDRFADMKTYM